MNVQLDFGAGIEFLERDPDDAGESVRVDLRFAMQDLAGDGQRQFDDFAFDAAVVILPFEGELLERMADLLAILGDGSVEFGAELLLRALASLLEGFGLPTAASFLGDLAGIEPTARGAARWFGF